jgi:hypothetical protein
MEDVGFLWILGPFSGLLLYFMDIWYKFVVIWYIFSRFGILYQEKSGNPVRSVRLFLRARRKRDLQGDQIGRIFAHFFWANIYLGLLMLK